MTQPALQSSTPLEAFYKTFISIVYGFAASITLQWWAETLATDTMVIMHWLMFVGVTLLSFHFWLICISTDELENRIYSVLDVGKNKPLSFLLVYSLGMSLALAFPIIVMAKTCVTHTLFFWRAYLWLATISFLYDVVALSILVFAKPKQQQGSAPPEVPTTYGSVFAGWLLQDFLILLIAAGIYLLRHFVIVGDLLLSVLFLATTLGNLIFDIVWANPELYLSDTAS